MKLPVVEPWYVALSLTLTLPLIRLNLATVTLLFDNEWFKSSLVNKLVGEEPSRFGTNLARKNLPLSVESLLILKPEYSMKKSEYVSLFASNITTSVPVVNVLVNVVSWTSRISFVVCEILLVGILASIAAGCDSYSGRYNILHSDPLSVLIFKFFKSLLNKLA